MHRFLLVLVLSLAGCEIYVPPVAGPGVGVPQARTKGLAGGTASAAFGPVARSVEPVAERECRSRTQARNCNFLIRIDPDPKAPANAYQSLDRSGRPVITFTRKMLAELANPDELAFVMSHEAAHHIRGHLARQEQNAISGAIIFAGLATMAGASASDIVDAQDLGAMVGARSYSKDFELEADQLGTIITHQAGFRPSVGVMFFARLPDPGDRFLGSHPANHDRVKIVQQTIHRYNLN
ncbi:M48 family metalloprotease [Parasedimentitalea psychrophila]|uniref:M48 family metalloprotease n=1 Tax=Parasedimentitalea psychrophila TaxID=2997337 RepID=A0A9Y2KUQ6_9RHOB|nr:M48 family metalloprotease [Parasedimentitalea psychrophila]WIY23495.1 M48 family metalloprotease [Parasedimentitalea psychrophila]